MMPPMRCSILLTLSLAAVVAFIPRPLHAQMYRWVDGSGVPHYAEGLDAVPERYRANAIPLLLRNKPAPPADPDTGSARRTPAGGTVIDYVPGQHIMVEVRINGVASARLILDTGADRTLISPRALAAAGVSLSRTVATGRIVGVTGSDRLPYVMVDSLEIGDVRVGRLPVGAYDVAEAAGDGLLGRDVLDRFNVAIDAAQGRVTLSPK
jgi:predicted aspartyl protease